MVDHARARLADKRSACSTVNVSLASLANVAVDPQTPISDVLSIDHTLGRLAARDPEHARIVELRFCAGLSIEETAQVLGRSPATIKRAWRLAKAWLFRELRLREADQESRTR